MKSKQYEVIDNVEKLESAIERVRKAQEIFSTYSQETSNCIRHDISYINLMTVAILRWLIITLKNKESLISEKTKDYD